MLLGGKAGRPVTDKEKMETALARLLSGQSTGLLQPPPDPALTAPATPTAMGGCSHRSGPRMRCPAASLRLSRTC